MENNDKNKLLAIIRKGKMSLYDKKICLEILEKNVFLKTDTIDIFDEVFELNKPSVIIIDLLYVGILEEILPELVRSRKVFQNKKNTNSVFDHTLKVIDICPSKFMRWVALFHDLGKLYTEETQFKYHEYYSLDIVDKYFLGIKNVDEIKRVIALHMDPLQYQVDPNWTNSTINRKISILGYEDAIQFSIYDKKASGAKEKSLQPLYDLLDKAIEYNNTAKLFNKVDLVENEN